MRVLWVCNQCIPAVAQHLQMNTGNKEGWLAGLSERILKEKDTELKLGICFPVNEEMADFKGEYEVTAYGFYEDRVNFHIYSEKLEDRFKEIIKDFKPDLIHIFGTEYGHTLAVCKAVDDPSKLLIGIQGLCSVYAKHYFDGLPESLIKSSTLRDFLKKDNIVKQQEKFVIRGEYEIEALSITKNVTGRTDWDKFHTSEIKRDVNYYFMNETLRSNFYEGLWDYKSCEEFSIFVSQGDYPIKGLHILLEVLGKVKEKYPSVKVYVSGNKINGEDSLKKKILIGSYGKYINKLIKENKLKDNIVFLGSLNASQMKDRYLKSNLYLSPSMMENSPNSVGEAMLLGMPLISSDVGGVKNLLVDKEEGFLYDSLDRDALLALIEKVFEMNGSEEQKNMGLKAREHALKTHDADTNYQRLLEIYTGIAN